MDIRQRFELLESKKLSHRAMKRHIWDLFSFIGNLLFQRFPPDVTDINGKRFLNLGSGEINKDGYTNADFYRLHKIFSNKNSFWMVDITKPLKCEDNWWDGVHLEHVNEHLSYLHNLELLKELYRTLKPGGIVRITVPDLDKYLEWNDTRHSNKKMARYLSLPEAISNLSQNHLHISVWNFQLFNEVMEEVGFVDVKKKNFGESDSSFVDAPNHEWQSLYLEARK